MCNGSVCSTPGCRACIVGRSVATVAELCFAMQWAIVLRELGRITPFRHDKEYRQSDRAADRARGMLFLVRGDLDEFSRQRFGKYDCGRSSSSLIGVALMRLVVELSRRRREFRIAAAAAGVAGLCRVHVDRRRADVFRALAGGTWRTAGSSRLVRRACTISPRTGSSRTISRQWQDEIPWMSLYFSAAVWSSLMLGGFGLVRHLVPRYRVRRPLVKPTRRPIPSRSVAS